MLTNRVLIFVGYIPDLNSVGNSMIPYYIKNINKIINISLHIFIFYIFIIITKSFKFIYIHNYMEKLIFDRDIKINNVNFKSFKISSEDSIHYFNNNNIHKKWKKHNDLNDCINNCEYINMSNSIVYDNILKPTPQYTSILDNKLYDVYNIYFTYTDAPIVIFWCNINDPFCVIQNTSYMDFFFIIYINEKLVIEISHSTAGHAGQLPNILNILFFNNNIISSNNSLIKKYIFVGFNENVGHYLWNELSGLSFFLEDSTYHDLIDGIVIGPRDHFNIKDYLTKTYKFNLLSFKDIYGELYNCYKELNCIPLFINSFYINNNVKKMFLVEQRLSNNTNIIELCFDLRTLRRCLINQDLFYKFIIEQLLNDIDFASYTFIINICGLFSTNCFKIDENNKEFIDQNILFDNISSSTVNNRIAFNNLIGKDMNELIAVLIHNKISLTTVGTSMPNICNWAYNIKCITFGPKESYQWQCIHYTVLKNYNYIYLPIEYITESNGLQNNFNVDYIKTYDFFKKELIKQL